MKTSLIAALVVAGVSASSMVNAKPAKAPLADIIPGEEGCVVTEASEGIAELVEVS